MRKTLALFALALAACGGSSRKQTGQAYPQPYPQNGYSNQGYGNQGYSTQGYPNQGYQNQQQGYPNQGYPNQTQPQNVPPNQQVQPAPRQPVPQPPAQRAQLAPLLPFERQNEVRAVLAELVAQLGAPEATRVKTVPLTFDNQDPAEINAYAGCDDSGNPFLAGTDGLLEVIDAIAQTKAADELFGTKTYDAYTARILPPLGRGEKTARPGLPPDIIPAQYVFNTARLSRAHEIFDDVAAFTFGHELAHHYLGHTGCANGQAGVAPPPAAVLQRLATKVIPLLSQTTEADADRYGCINVLNAGRARLPKFRWSERGGLILFDFFTRLERASGVGLLSPVHFIASHPNPGLRGVPVQWVASGWYQQNPQVAH